jgi:ABC-type enterochelin transport system substrate-binding protein
VSAVPTLKGPIQQLQDIESSIMLMFEERNYIEEKAETNKEIAQQFYDAEKKADKIRRDFRYELRRKHEAEAELGRKLKIEKRM